MRQAIRYYDQRGNALVFPDLSARYKK
jgi:hypothetical protein